MLIGVGTGPCLLRRTGILGTSPNQGSRKFARALSPLRAVRRRSRPRRTPPSAAAIAAAFTPVVIRSSSGRESVRVCGRSIDVATDEAHAGREQPDEPGGEP